MSVIQQQLSALHLPPCLPQNARPGDWPELRQRIIKVLLQHEYGIVPPLPCSVTGEVLSEEQDFCAGKSILRTIRLTVTLPGGAFSFPCRLSMPVAPGDHPLFVSIDFFEDIPNRYLPVEEICDRRYAVLSIHYNDVSVDRDDHFEGDLDKLLRGAAAQSGVAPDQLPGKIAIWAWAASRALDWAITQPGVSQTRLAVIGHSRLGKTALLCGLLDERFACVISNDSGCSGAAITREKPGERVAEITRNFPYWFCDAYRQYAGQEQAMPFEQDWLLAGIAPRLLLVGSAQQDEWAAPRHEYLGCVSASKAWQLLHLPGLVHPDRFPCATETLHEGSIGYHMRGGRHYLSREDWNHYMDFLDAKGWQNS